MSQPKLLLVEDELALATIIKDSLQNEGFTVDHFAEGALALKHFFASPPDLIILDVMLPKSNGFDLAKTIRKTDPKTPILFLTAKAQVKDVVTGFKAGGNDYLRKPFGIEELIIRIKVLMSDARLLEDPTDSQQTVFQLGDISFNAQKQTLTYLQESTIQLTARESELLKLFCENPNRLVPKKNILLKIWGDDSFFNSRSMDVFISKLRKHLKKDPTLKIINVRGSGYKLIIG